MVLRGALMSLMFVACIAEKSAPPPAPPQTKTESPSAPPVAPSPVRAQEIYIDSVTATNPVIVKGRARTFENAVSLRVRDAGGEVIAEEHVTSVGEMGTHNPYEAQLWLVHVPGRQLTVEAFEYSAKDGSVQSLTAKAIPYSVDTIRATLVFPAGDCTRFVTVSRELPKSVAMARLLVEALLGGPDAAEKAAGATAPFPEHSDVKSVILRDGVLTVDFNERLQNVGGSCAALAIRESVTRTLRQLPSVKRLVITAGGSEALALQP